METLRFHSLAELEALSQAELDALWELVPTQRQRHYQARLERAVRLQGAHGSDRAEQQVVAALLDKYAVEHLVPVGERWVKVPPRIQAAAQAGQGLEAPETAHAPRRPLAPLLLIAGGLLFFACLLGVVLLRGGQGDVPATPTAEVAQSPAPRRTATPTPIALVESDAVIRQGDTDRALAYPIGLQIRPLGAEQPRVFIVQRRRVDLAEWAYDPNPDTASFLSDLPVRLVIGIPHTRENTALFDQLAPGATLVLRLNTGGELRFVVEGKSQVRRSDTRIFRQLGPGLSLVLIGETGADGLPTGQRWVVSATYLAAQELARDGDLLSVAGVPTLPPTSTPWVTATPPPVAPRELLPVALIQTGVTTQGDRLTVRLRIYNNQAVPVTLRPADFRLALGYTPQPPGPWLQAEGLTPVTVQPGQALDVTLVWPWAGEPFGVLEVLLFRFGLAL